MGESQYRQYFFDTALHKALRSHNAKERVKDLLGQSETFKTINPDMTKAYTNAEWKIILGEDTYENMLDMLSKGKFFNPLLKDELLSVMDRLRQECGNMKEFRDRLKKKGIICVWYREGEISLCIWHSDRALSERYSPSESYRFGKLLFAGKQMTADEKSIICITRSCSS